MGGCDIRIILQYDEEFNGGGFNGKKIIEENEQNIYL